MSGYRIVLIAHLFGLAFGVGGAGTIDAILLVASRRARVSRDLVGVVHAAAGLVAAATVLLAVSGVAFFAVGAETTPKFWAKMVIVAVACLNGLAAHRLVFPLIEAAAASGTGRLRLRPWPARLTAASAAVSGVSWSGALVLGAWHDLKLGVVPILAAFASVLAAAVLVSAILVAPRVFVFAPAAARRRRVTALGALRLVAVAAARAVALAVAAAALAIAARLGSGSGGAETDVVDGFAAPADAIGSGRLPAPDAPDRSQGPGVPPDRRLPRELFASGGRFPRLYSRGWPSHLVDAESETGRR